MPRLETLKRFRNSIGEEDEREDELDYGMTSAYPEKQEDKTARANRARAFNEYVQTHVVESKPMNSDKYIEKANKKALKSWETMQDSGNAYNPSEAEELEAWENVISEKRKLPKIFTSPLAEDSLLGKIGATDAIKQGISNVMESDFVKGKVSEATARNEERKKLEDEQDKVTEDKFSKLSNEQLDLIDKYNDARTSYKGAAASGMGYGALEFASSINDAETKLVNSGLSREDIKELSEYRTRQKNAKLAEEEAAMIADDVNNRGKLYNVGLGAETVLSHGLEAMAGAEDLLKKATGQRVDTNDALHRLQKGNQAIRQEQAANVERNHGTQASEWYQAVMSAADNITDVVSLTGAFSGMGIGKKAAGKIAESIILSEYGLKAYASSYDEALKRGVSEKNANATALVDAAAESLTEVLSLDIVIGALTSGNPQVALATLIGTTLLGGFTEGMEEKTSQFCSTVADVLINGEYSQLYKDVKELGKEKAIDKYIQESEQAYNVAFKSGVLMGGGASGIRYISSTVNANDMFKEGNYKEIADAIDTSPEAYGNNKKAISVAERAKDMAEKLAKKQEEGQNVTLEDKRKLYEYLNLNVENAYEKGKRNVSNEAAPAEPVEANIEETKEEAPVEIPAEYQNDYATVDDAINDLKNADDIATVEKAYKSIMAEENVDEIALEEAKTIYALKSNKYTEAARENAKANLTKAEIYEAGARNEELKDMTDDEKLIWNQGRGDALLKKNVTVDDTKLKENLAKYGEDAKKLFDLKGDVNSYSYQRYIDDVYHIGASGGSFSGALNSIPKIARESIDHNALAIAFEHGQNDNAAQPKNIKTTTWVSKKGSGSVKSDSRFNVAQVDLLKLVAEDSGLDIDLTKELSTKDINGRDVAVNGYLKAFEGVLKINVDKLEKAAQTIFHEGVGEFTQAFGNQEKLEKAHAAIIDYMVSKDREGTIKAIKDTYNLYNSMPNRTASWYDAAGEVVNDFIVELFKTEEGMTDFFQNTISRYGKKQAESVKDIIVKFFEHMAEVVRTIFTGQETRFSELGDMLDEKQAKYLRDLVLDAYNSALDNYQNIEVREDAKAESKEQFAFNVINEKQVQDYIGRGFERAIIDSELAITNEDFGAMHHDIVRQCGKRIEDGLSKKFNGIAFSANYMCLFENYDVDDFNVTYIGSIDSVIKEKYDEISPGRDERFSTLLSETDRLREAGSDWHSIYDEIRRGSGKDARLSDNKQESNQRTTSNRNDEHIKKDKKGRVIPPKNQNLLDYRFSLEIPEDSDGNKLSDGQMKKFKNSKMLDDQGRLKVMYHGTTQYGFSVFDPKHTDDGQSIFFTDSEQVAQSYSGTSLIRGFGKELTVSELNKYLPKDLQAISKDGAYYLINTWNDKVDDKSKASTIDDLYKYYENEYGDTDGNAGNYKVYLNIENPLIVVSSGDSDYFYWEEALGYGFNYDEYQEYLGNNAEGVERDEYIDSLYPKKHNWTTKEWSKYAKDNGYDGVIFKDIMDVGEFGDDSVSESDVAIVFNSNQIKSVDNENPTDSNDIRFSLEVPVEETKDLIAVHSMHEAELLKTIELGGFPMPSIAVMRSSDAGANNQYGDVSVIFGKDTIDPKKNKSNKVYSGDAWTPTFPTVKYHVNEKQANALYSKMIDMTNKQGIWMLNSVDFHPDNLDDAIQREGGIEGVIERYKDSIEMKQVYLAQSNNQLLEYPTKQVKSELSPIDVAKREEIAKVLPDNYADMTSSEKIDYITQNIETLREAMAQAYAKTSKNGGIEKGRNLASKIKWDRFKDVADKAIDYVNNGSGNITYDTVNDAEKAREIINERVDQKEYEKWLEGLFDGLDISQGIYNGKERYTNSGSRRSWNALHDEITLENIVKAMKRDTQKGAGIFGMGQPIAASTYEFTSIDDIRSRKNQLTVEDEQEYEKIRSEFTDRFSEIAVAYVKPENSEKFGAHMDAGQALCEAVAGSKTKSGLQTKLKADAQWFNYSDAILDDLWSLVEDIRNMPTGYFEAKPQRAVGLDEIAYVVVPNNASENLITALDNAGIAHVSYEAENEESRLNAVNSRPDVQFSLDIPENTTVDFDYDSDITSIIKQGEKELKNAPVDVEAINKVTSNILKKWGSSYDKQTLNSNLQKLFAYLQNSGEVNYNDFERLMAEVARPVITASYNVDEQAKENYEGFRNYLRGLNIKLSDEQKNEVVYAAGSYANFNRANMWWFHSDPNGIPLNDLWSDIVSNAKTYGINTLDNVDSDVDQIIALEDAIRTAKNMQYTQAYEGTEEEAARQLSLEILSDYFKVMGKAGGAKALKAEIDKYKDKVEARYKARYEKAYNDLYQSGYEKGMKDLSDHDRKEYARQIAELKAKHKENLAEIKEERTASDYKKSINATAGKLFKMLEQPTDKNHVPQALRTPLAEFLNSVDFVSHKADPNSASTVRWQEKMLKLQSFLNNASEISDVSEDNRNAAIFGYGLDESLSGMIDDFLDMAGNKQKVSQLSYEGLGLLDKILKSLHHTINKANETYANEKFKNANELAEKTMSELHKKREARLHNPLFKSVGNFFNYDMLDPLTFFEQLGEGALSVEEALRSGFDKRVWHIDEAQKYMKDVLGKTDLSSWTGKNATVHRFNTDDGVLKLTTGQIMYLYAARKDADTVRHILTGGLKASDMSKLNRSNRFTQSAPVMINDMMLDDIFASLTEKQKEVADKMQYFLSHNVASWMNETSMAMYGYEKANNINYMPITVDSNDIASKNDNIGNTGLWDIKNTGATKSRNKGASGAIVAGDIFDVFIKNVTDIANYNAYVEPLTDAMRWINYKATFNMGGKQYTSTVKQELERAYGTSAQKYILDFIKAINGEKKAGGMPDFWSRFISNTKGAAVMGNLSVVVQQPTAAFRAMSEISPFAIAQAQAEMANPKKLVEYKDKAQSKSAIALWKSWGYYETSIGKSMSQVIIGNATVTDKIKDATSLGAQLADDFTWAMLYRAAEIDTAKKNPTLKGKALEDATVKAYNKMIDRTQVVDSVFHKTRIMRESDGLVKLYTAFMSEPSKQYTMLYRAGVNWANDKSSTNLKYLMGASTGVLLANIAAAAAKALITTMRHDDDDKDKKEIYEEEIISLLQDNLKLWNNIPFVKDIAESVENGIDGKVWGNNSSMDSQVLSDLTNALMRLKNLSEGKEYSVYSNVQTFSKLFSDVSGIPAYNVTRDAIAVYNFVVDNNVDTSSKAINHSTEAKQEMIKAIDSGDVRNGVQEYMNKYLELNPDKTKEEAKKSAGETITNKYKEELIALYSTDKQAANELKRKMLDAYVAAGYKREDKNKTINKWFE